MDIVQRLRKGRSANEWVSEELAREAADEIERLREAVRAISGTVNDLDRKLRVSNKSREHSSDCDVHANPYLPPKCSCGAV